jgi:hypothetical protein
MDDSSPQAASPAALARTAAEAIRSLNHLTLGADGLQQPADVYEVLGDLSLAASRIPQLISQIGRWLATALAAGVLGCDDRTDPACAVSGAWIFLSGARGSAAALARDLEAARQQLGAVNSSTSQEEETS